MEAGAQDGIVVNDQYTTGYDASVSVYPLVNVTTTSQKDDLTGTWRITLGDEETIPLSHRATHKKVQEALDLLKGVGKVALVGTSSRATGLQLGAQTVRKSAKDSLRVTNSADTAIIYGNLTNAIAIGDTVTIKSGAQVVRSTLSKQYLPLMKVMKRLLLLLIVPMKVPQALSR